MVTHLIPKVLTFVRIIRKNDIIPRKKIHFKFLLKYHFVTTIYASNLSVNIFGNV